jgi:hypothetical protein
MKRICLYASPFAFMLAFALGTAGSRVDAGQAAARPAPARGQAPATPGKASDAAQTSRGSGETDPNVKTAAGPNDPAVKTPAPAKKGGPKTRGMACYVTFDNYTGWRLEAFVDGTFRGIVPAWGELDTVTGDGFTSIYARARFTDGSMKYWGPRSGSCVNEAFNWVLNP